MARGPVICRGPPSGSTIKLCRAILFIIVNTVGVQWGEGVEGIASPLTSRKVKKDLITTFHTFFKCIVLENLENR